MSEKSVRGTDKGIYLSYETWTLEESVYVQRRRAGLLRGRMPKREDCWRHGVRDRLWLGELPRFGCKGSASVAGTEINPASIADGRSRGVELLPATYEDGAEPYAGRFDTVVGLDVFQFEYNHRWIYERAFHKDVFDIVADLPYTVAAMRSSRIDLLRAWHPELDRFFEANYLRVHERALGWFDVLEGRFDVSNTYA